MKRRKRPSNAEGWFQHVIDVLEDVHGKLFSIIGKHLAKDVDKVLTAAEAEVWKTRRVADINDFSRDVRAVIGYSLRETLIATGPIVEDGYLRGGRLADVDIETYVKTPKTSLTPVKTRLNNTITGTYEAELRGDLLKLHTGLLRSANATYRSVLDDAVLEMGKGNITLQQATARTVDRWAKQGLPGFVDRAGRGWRPETYAEMCLRTSFTRASIQGKIDRFQERGQDLVVVSDSPEECPVCRVWERKILSVKTSFTPPAVATVGDARAAGLFHPRCTHTVDLYIEGVSTNPPANSNKTGYELSQKQRRLERETREARRRAMAAEKVGDAEQVAKAKKRVVEKRSALKKFIDETGRMPRVGADLLPKTEKNRS